MFGQVTLAERDLSRRAVMLRDSMALLRRDAGMCQASVNHEEAEFREFAGGVDSMLTGVESFEEAGPQGRGVEQEAYPEYIEAFDEYNDAVGDWEEKAEELEARATACRRLFVQHNQLVDTLRVLVDRLGEK